LLHIELSLAAADQSRKPRCARRYGLRKDKYNALMDRALEIGDESFSAFNAPPAGATPPVAPA
jgi:hypothetical protein